MFLLNTDSLRGYGLNRIFKFAKEAEFDGIDLSVNFGQFDTYDKDYIKELIEKYELPVHSISTPTQITASNIKSIVEMAKSIDAKVVVLQPPRFLDQKLAKWMTKEIPKLREKERISIALENSPSGTWLLGLLPSHALSNTQDLKRFKHVALDTSRIGEKKQDLIRTYAIFRKHLVHIHISNIYHGNKYAPPQEGILPLESFLTKIKQDNYPGALSLKVNPKYLKVEAQEEMLENLSKIKKFIDKYYTNVEIRAIENDEENNNEE